MEKAEKELLKRFQEGSCSKGEKAMVESWYLNWGDEQGAPSFSQIEHAKRESWSRLSVNQNQINRKTYYRIILVAASLLLILSISLYYYISKPEISKQQVHEITTGKVGATLTLANGEKIKLDSASDGTLVNNSSIMLYISTAKGETYQVLLPDGSKAWLNADSRLTYSTNFYENGKRTIKLEGEGYFEVKKDKLYPFIVISKNQETKVLGTSFNVKAYAEEKEIKTTLIEGSLQVTVNGRSILLQPNQQANVVKGQIHTYSINANDEVAWKDGYFTFQNISIESMMNIIGRWYSVDIVYLDDTKTIKGEVNVYRGTVSRNIKLEHFLHLLEYTGNFKFTIERNRVLVNAVNVKGRTLKQKL